MADPARCASEPRPYLRTSALTNTCEALAMYLPGTCAGRTSATRQLRGAWPLRYPALATDQSYRLTKMESGDAGCVATSAQRHSAGSAPGMTALVEANRHASSAEGLSRPAAVAVAVQTLAQHFYMPNRPLALVERAQAAINNIATQSTLHKGDAGIRCADQPLRISAAHEIHRMGLRGRFGETATERQPEQCQKPERRKDLEPFDAKSLIHMVRLAGIEPTTPWFVAKYSIQLSYSR